MLGNGGEKTLTKEEVNDALNAQMYFQTEAKRILGFTDVQVENAIKQYGRECCLEAIEEYSKAAMRKEEQGNPVDNPPAFFHGVCKRLIKDHSGRRY